MQKFKIKSNLKELLLKHNMDQKTLHKITKVRETTVGEMANDTNKTFARDNLNSIIDALKIKDIRELLSIVEVEDKEDKKD